MKNVTKAQISKVLRTENITNIFKIASKAGINVSDRHELLLFIEENAPSAKVASKAYSLSYGASDKNQTHYGASLKQPIISAIRFAKWQKKEGETNYSKILIEGNTNIYWASPIYEHADYNKSVAFSNTSKNRNIAKLINKYLNF